MYRVLKGPTLSMAARPTKITGKRNNKARMRRMALSFRNNFHTPKANIVTTYIKIGTIIGKYWTIYFILSG
ncbi:MAG: hypothetical protein NPIRA01_05890 [Nitrospirales bacterium]|nr:MAG: hypothetical protein NPIRA01_05890 [Nitrospirales bacterium]